MRQALAAILLSILSLTGLSHNAMAQAVVPQLVILDTDIGDDIDDVLALSLALTSPEMKLLGITSAWGDTDTRSRLLDRFLEQTGRGETPVATGIEKHRRSEAEFSQRRWAERSPKRTHPEAVTFLLQQIEAHPNQITLVAVAPLTNVAAAYERSPTTFRKLRRIVMMGGSLDRGYDDLGYLPLRGPMPEYNIAMDVKAAQAVFSSGVPISLMPLDSTQLKLDEFRRQILFTRSNPLTDALALLYLQWSQTTRQQTPTVYDAMAVAYAVKPDLCPTEPIHLRVDDRGMTIRSAGGPKIDVCLNSDSDSFFRFYIPRLLNFAPVPTESRYPAVSH